MSDDTPRCPVCNSPAVDYGFSFIECRNPQCVGFIKTVADLEKAIGVLIAELKSKDAACQAAAAKLESALRQTDKLAVAKDVEEAEKCPGVANRLCQIAHFTRPESEVKGVFLDGLVFVISKYGI